MKEAVVGESTDVIVQVLCIQHVLRYLQLGGAMGNLVVSNFAGAAVASFHKFKRKVKVEVGDVIV